MGIDELKLGQEVITVDLANGMQRTGKIVAISYVAMAVQVRLGDDTVWLDIGQVSTKER